MGHRSKHSKSDEPKESNKKISHEMVWVAPPEDVDPVCATKVNTKTAKSSVHNGTVYYLCSRECREIFEANPEAYIIEETGKVSDTLKEITHA